ncbi:GTPase-associated protein 1-related protein [Actinomadura sp. DC4]|uniref:GTPase-associated protein 1-related protein n=1 Tax=Actinomadura sp. DC4 TaxID=3055069 RepID=UPI0025B1E5E9|nr:GTPase-associated protein 1-related protein [Actinomadura sp. DC4]MDN3353864.1 GTPase-associated protein 1-related protein [Actinomadura sp. DC4]
MTFRQLYYTSCENGLAGYGGYQFNAVTPGVSTPIMREVEDGTVYEPPREFLATPPEDPGVYPVAFSHAFSEASEATITAQVVFAGDDYSGRPGNYFAHALVTETPEADFGALLPVELWGAPFWRRVPVRATELPALSGPPARGAVDRPDTQAFLDARGGAAMLPVLLSAVDRAMAGDKPVLLAGRDAAENAWWIAALSYLLGDRLGRRMTFTTYSHRPGYTRHHVIGLLAEALPRDAELAFHLFDAASGGTPGIAVHPLAALLVRSGVMATAGLWQQAGAFASGGEADLDGWYAPVAAAAALLGTALTAEDVAAVASWLPAAAGRLPAQHTGVVLDMLLGRPPDTLDDARVRGLLDVASRLGSGGRVERLEELLTDRTFGRGDPIRITTPRVREKVRARVAEALPRIAPEAALTLLTWAEAAGADPFEADLERYGRTLDASAPEAALAALLGGRPAVLHGLLDRLARATPEEARRALGGPLAGLVGRGDLTAHPVLAEQWWLIAADGGRAAPLEAFDRIRDLRRTPLFDGALLTRLWPRGCPPEDLTELLDAVADPPPPDVLDWFAHEIADASRDKRTEGWLRLAEAIAEHPLLPRLPVDVRNGVRGASRVAPLLGRARKRVPKGDVGVFAELYQAYEYGGDDVRRLLRRELSSLLAQADPLGAALRGCPEEVLTAFGDDVWRRLSPLRADRTLAARVFAALAHFDVTGRPVEQTLAIAFGPVREWKRRELNALARQLDPETADRFQAWRDEYRGSGRRRLFGDARSSRGER